MSVARPNVPDGDGAGNSQPTDVHNVMHTCQCDEETAARLLKQCNNDLEKAIVRYEIERLYGVSTAPIEAPTSYYDLDDFSLDSSDDDLTLVAPSPGNLVLESPRLPSKPPPPPKKPQKLQVGRPPVRGASNSRSKPRATGTLGNIKSNPQPVQPVNDDPSEVVSRGVAGDKVANPANFPHPPGLESIQPDAIPPRTQSSRLLDQTHHNNIIPIQNPDPTQSKASSVAGLSTAPDDELDRQEDLGIEKFEAEIEEPQEPVKVPEWDFILPEIPPPISLAPGVGEGNQGFSLEDLVGAIQHGTDIRVVTEYLAYYDSDVVKKQLSSTLAGFPSIFFAVGTNNETLIRLWIAFGADVSAVHEESGVPLLAFAIMNSEYLDTDTTLMVSTLLSLGAAPEDIPASFYTPFLQDLPESGPTEENMKIDSQDRSKAWCTISARAKLARTANISQRYYLERASKAKKPSSRHKQVAKLRNAEALLGISYFLIGQTMATNRLFQKLLTYMMVRTKRPLVMVFAGPSGHGKTELARRLGHLMSLDLEIVDCTIYSREIELFGPRNPYVGAEQGSPLNNFLVKNAGKRCIVFLDEFEKTTSDIHQALLVPFDNGEYQDRRDLKKIDCSKTVWILATNALDPTIQKFCKLHHKPIFEDDDDTEKLRLMKSLSKAIKEDFLSQFGSPVTGRISDFIPFLPFSPGEQAVIVHKFLLELGEKVRGPVNLVPGPKEQLIGNVRMRIRRDASVCRILAEEEYHSDLGARSLIMGARKLEDLLVDVYLQVDEEIRESERVVEFMVDVNGSEVIAKMVEQPKIDEVDTL
ncbi:hypothetical protein VTL71DRAFT_1171 [Oculimacula yallundae]|uniref:AAA+ ATPase domain-containing protein n=1 Tax=Oculimacula yallundae TaxID=86028 RepID=A0ABR4D239_9HELO